MKLTTKKLKQLIKEELSEMMKPTPYDDRFGDEEMVKNIKSTAEKQFDSLDDAMPKAHVEVLLSMLGVSGEEMVDLRNRLRGMRLDMKGESVLSFLEKVDKLEDY